MTRRHDSEIRRGLAVSPEVATDPEVLAGERPVDDALFEQVPPGERKDPPGDVMQRGWAQITVRLAWSLRRCGVEPDTETLRHARTHLLYVLDPSLSVWEAEDRTERIATALAARLRGKRWRSPFPEDDDLVPQWAWREKLFQGATRERLAVLRFYIGEGFTFSEVADHAALPEDRLHAPLVGLRDTLRAAAALDRVDLTGWSDERIDHLLHRVVSMSAPDLPPFDQIVDGQVPEAVDRCLCAARAYRMHRRGALTRNDLMPPAEIRRPIARTRALHLQLRGEGIAHRDQLRSALPGRTQLLGDDGLLVEVVDDKELSEVLSLAAQVERPRAEDLRGHLIEGPGRWSPFGLLGPLPARVQPQIDDTRWGDVRGLDGEGLRLPEALVAPPSALWMWGVALVLAVLAGLGLHALDQPGLDRGAFPIRVEASAARGGMWLDLDVDDSAYLHLVGLRDGRLEVLHHGLSPADKARFATGDGRFRLHAEADEVLLVSTPEPLDSLPDTLLAVEGTPAPLEAVAQGLRATSPGADIVHLVP